MSFELIKITDSVKRFNSFKCLLSRNLITTRKTYVCKVCSYQQSDGLKTPQEKNITDNIETEDNILQSISKTIDFLKRNSWRNLSSSVQKALTELARGLGNLINNEIFDDGKVNIASQHKNIQYLKQIDPTN